MLAIDPLSSSGSKASEAVLTSTHNLCFEQKNEKYQIFLIWKFYVFGGKMFYIFT